ncbi:pyruvate kinase [Clostridium taeniosporum]|uniref:Pyruvate kinase n=1 Tax=Clostridium taeniosporum TaxID=394958 RepID=A0A1D7XLF7_9CLOT|nr:pyruvate kinase [Clostridium taeniosporum]AOR24185.1 pyruvate kinase [Clostridium taeniosporum]
MYIIATVGPNIMDKRVLKDIFYSGANSLRFNFSHGNSNEFLEYIKMAKSVKEDVVIILDLCGNKIRVSNKLRGVYKVYDEEKVYFCGEDRYKKVNQKLKNNNKIIPLNIENTILLENNYKNISIKDNTMMFNILEKEDDFLKAITIRGGIIRAGKGCNIRGFDRSKMRLSSKDREDIKFGINNKVDIICQSFVDNVGCIDEVLEFINLTKEENYSPKIWAKIETIEGIKNIDEILTKVDGIVIGRGDLIAETSIEDTPIHEEFIIKKVKKYYNKEIVIATHVLDSMKRGKMPSVSEVESIYNFIKQGVNGFLLAGETSVGRAPIKTVKFLKDLIKKYE